MSHHVSLSVLMSFAYYTDAHKLTFFFLQGHIQTWSPDSFHQVTHGLRTPNEGINQRYFEKLGRCGRQNMLWPYQKIWDWDWIFGRAVKSISSLGVRSPWSHLRIHSIYLYYVKHIFRNLWQTLSLAPQSERKYCTKSKQNCPFLPQFPSTNDYVIYGWSLTKRYTNSTI